MQNTLSIPAQYNRICAHACGWIIFNHSDYDSNNVIKTAAKTTADK